MQLGTAYQSGPICRFHVAFCRFSVKFCSRTIENQSDRSAVASVGGFQRPEMLIFSLAKISPSRRLYLRQFASGARTQARNSTPNCPSSAKPRKRSTLTFHIQSALFNFHRVTSRRRSMAHCDKPVYRPGFERHLNMRRLGQVASALSGSILSNIRSDGI